MKTSIKFSKKQFNNCLWIFVVITSSLSFSSVKYSNFNNPSTVGKEVHLKAEFKFRVRGHINSIMLKMMIPVTKKDKQTVNNLTFSIQPDSIYTREDNTYAVFRFHNVTESFKLVITGNLTIYNIIKDKNEDTIVNFSRYLKPEKFIECKDRAIVASSVQLKQRTDIETAIRTYEFVDSSLKYKKKESIGAAEVLESGEGKCTDFSDLFVALLRANRIPAKSVCGIVVDTQDANPLHAWTEVYLRKQGWVRFDPTFRCPVTQIGKNYSMAIQNRYIDLAEGRNEKELQWHPVHFEYKADTNEGSVKLRGGFDAYSW